MSVLLFLALVAQVASSVRSGKTVGGVARTGRRTIERDSPFVAHEMERVLRDLQETAPAWRQPAIERQAALLRTAVGRARPPTDTM